MGFLKQQIKKDGRNDEEAFNHTSAGGEKRETKYKSKKEKGKEKWK